MELKDILKTASSGEEPEFYGLLAKCLAEAAKGFSTVFILFSEIDGMLDPEDKLDDIDVFSKYAEILNALGQLGLKCWPAVNVDHRKGLVISWQ